MPWTGKRGKEELYWRDLWGGALDGGGERDLFERRKK